MAGTRVIAGAPEGQLRKALFLCFTLDHSEDDAAAIYERRFGQPPELILEWGWMLRLGPIDVKRSSA
jgi:hypothetical protein